jgi:hypothetical protein
MFKLARGEAGARPLRGKGDIVNRGAVSGVNPLTSKLALRARPALPEAPFGANGLRRGGV